MHFAKQAVLALLLFTAVWIGSIAVSALAVQVWKLFHRDAPVSTLTEPSG